VARSPRHRIAHSRAAAQGLSGPRDRSAAALVERFGAVQAQDYPYARWAVAQRLTHGVDAVEAAVAAGAILRTHVLRPTWHFVPRDDLRWMQALTAARVRALMRSIDRRHGIDDALVRKATRVIASALDRRGHLTRREIGDELRRAGIHVGDAWATGELLLHAELQAVVCSGAPRGRQQTYALVDERAPRSVHPERDEALATLAARYFQSHGPATIRDFRWWSGLDAASAARGVDAIGRRLDRTTVEGRDYLAIDPPPRTRGGIAQCVHPFDEVLVAYSESRDLVDVDGVSGARAGGLLLRGVVLDGQVVGTWTRGTGSEAIRVDLFGRAESRAQTAIGRARVRLQTALAHRAWRGSH
jgi:winged helix DNA-binding protein